MKAPSTGDGDSEFAMSLATPAALLAELPPQLSALLGGASALLVNARGETATAGTQFTCFSLSLLVLLLG